MYGLREYIFTILPPFHHKYAYPYPFFSLETTNSNQVQEKKTRVGFLNWVKANVQLANELIVLLNVVVGKPTLVIIFECSM